MIGTWSIYDWGRFPVSPREAEIIAQVDGHFCFDWDGLAVSAWTNEYDCCVCFKKTRLGRMINRLVMWRWNMMWWIYIGLPDKLRRED